MEDSKITVEDIFREIHLKGQQIEMAPPTVAREGIDPEAAVAEVVLRRVPRRESAYVAS